MHEMPPRDAATRAKIAQFREATVTHRLLAQTHHKIMQAVREPAGFTFLLVYGPAGVGKTRMIEAIQREIVARVSPSPLTSPGSICPALVIQADPPDGSPFDRGYYYHTVLTGLGETTYPLHLQIAPHADQGPLKRRRLPAAAVSCNDIPELREATKQAMPRHGLEVILVDEAHHILYAGKGEQGSVLQEQLEWLKSLSIGTRKVLYILVGTYHLLNFGRLNGELSRRCKPIHFPRYQLQREEDCVEFQAALLGLLQKVPLHVDVAPLVKDYWLYFYERSVGCVGNVKDWLLRAMSTALDEGQETLTLDRLQDQALEVEQCQQMMIDAVEGEQKLNYTEAKREQLWRLLLGGELVGPVPQFPPHESLPSEPQPPPTGQNAPQSLARAPLPTGFPEEDVQAQPGKKTRTRKKPQGNPPKDTTSSPVPTLSPEEEAQAQPVKKTRTRKKLQENPPEETVQEGVRETASQKVPGAPSGRRKKTAERVEPEIKVPSPAGAEAHASPVEAAAMGTETRPKRTRRVGEPKPRRYPVGEQATEQGAG